MTAPIGTSISLSQITQAISNLFTKPPSSSSSSEIQPICFKLPSEKGCVTLIVPETKQCILTFDRDKGGGIVIWNYEACQIQQTIEFSESVMEMKAFNGILFVRFYSSLQIQTFNLNTGEAVKLPSTWMNVINMGFGDNYTVHLNNAADAYYSNGLHMHKGMIYNSQWSPTVNYICDLNTLSTLLAKPKTKNAICTFNEVIEDTVVIADTKEIAIYKVKGEVHIPPPAEQQCQNELHIIQADGTKKLELQQKIECVGEPIICVKLLKFSNENLMAEGYGSGLVRLRSLTSGKVMMEFSPLEGQSSADSLQFSHDKLLVHYGKPSNDGTLAILWDLLQQKPCLKISREALKHKHDRYDPDQLHIIEDSILVRSEDDGMFYPGVLKS